MSWKRLLYLLPSRRRREESDMREELQSLLQIAGSRELGNLTLAAENARATWGWTWVESVAADIRYAFRTLRRQPGFVAVAVVSLALGIGANSAIFSLCQTHDFYRKLVDRARALPGVASVAMAESIPFSLTPTSITVVPEGYRFPQGRDKATVFGGAFDENYFTTMQVRMVRGRAFERSDRSETRRLAIVNEEFAKTYWPNQDPIGKRLRLECSGGAEAEVVGVAKTGRYLFPTEPPTLYVYLPYEQNQRSRMTLVAESHDDPALLAAPLRDLVRGLDADLPIQNLRTVASFYERRVVSNFLILLQTIAAMGLIGLTLAIAGLYGLMSYSVSRRTREIGIRMAIGASRSSVLRVVLRQGLILAVAGVAIGGLIVAAVAPSLAAGLGGLGPINVATFIVVPVALLAVGGAACHLPARRAAGLDPMRALRWE